MGSPCPNTLMLPFCADKFGMRSSKFSIVPAFSSTDPATVVFIPPFVRIVFGKLDFTTTSPSILLSSTKTTVISSPLQSLKAVLYPTDETFMIPLSHDDSITKPPSLPLMAPLTKEESWRFKRTTFAKETGLPVSSTIFPLMF